MRTLYGTLYMWSYCLNMPYHSAYKIKADVFKAMSRTFDSQPCDDTVIMLEAFNHMRTFIIIMYKCKFTQIIYTFTYAYVH